MIPDFDHPLGGTGQEDGGDEGVPGYVVDRGVVGGVGHEEPGAVLGRALVDQALVGADEEHGVVIRIERDASTPVP